MPDPQTFDEYVEQHNIQPGEYGQAFAAYLNSLTGWDGTAERIA